ncbi:DUF4337 family protein [Paraburkholderia sp. GAS334]|uniref:DUF4337 family protein n=1 Tax=Paraburkholderia sp. GAS334 TaxID=3035131 RepID=UPI003D1F55D0
MQRRREFSRSSLNTRLTIAQEVMGAWAALAAITLLTRKRWLQVMSLGVAVCGVSLGVAALLSW